MDAELKENKQTLRAFMRNNYSDERLAWLLAHARSGRLAYISCCCFIGVATADHALRGEMTDMYSEAYYDVSHYQVATELPGASDAERAYCFLSHDCREEQRVRRLIPIVKAEMRRRQRERESCPLCSHPLGAEFAVHNECATHENAMAERG